MRMILTDDFFRFRRSRTIAAPPDLVWKAIATPGILEKTHPFCRRNPVERWDGARSVDRVEYYSGLVFSRHFLEWSQGEGYDLEIRHDGRPSSRVRWRIRPVGSVQSELAISVESYRFRGFPRVLRGLMHAAVVRPVLSGRLAAYLDSLLKGFEQFVVTGRPVRRNEFGPLRRFSPRVGLDASGVKGYPQSG